MRRVDKWSTSLDGLHNLKYFTTTCEPSHVLWWPLLDLEPVVITNCKVKSSRLHLGSCPAHALDCKNSLVPTSPSASYLACLMPVCVSRWQRRDNYTIDKHWVLHTIHFCLIPITIF